MRGFYRFMALALIGFALGGGVALWQASTRTPAAVTAEDAASPAMPDTATATPAAQDSAATTATEMAVAGDDAQETAVSPAPDAAPAGTQHDHTAGHAVHEHGAEAPATGTAAETAGAAAQGHDHAGMMAAARSPAAAPPVGSAIGGAFTLTDHNGQAVTHESWPGKYKLVFFGFTHCPDICPAALDRMTSALDTLGDKAQQLQPLFITIDPARDDAATMKAYLGNYHASILGLTGSEAQIKQVEDVYKVYAARVETGTPVYTMAHSSFVFLMTPDDQLLDIFRDSDPADQMAAKIATRLDSAQP